MAPSVQRLFVYGTLRSGQGQAELLVGSRFRGRVRSAVGWGLVDLGEYPGLIPAESGRVWGELYEVDEATLQRLDRYEEVPTLFRRVTIPLEDGTEAIAYGPSQAPPAQAKPVEGGEWKPELSSTSKRSWHVGRWIFLRALGAVSLLAFLSLWIQVQGLYGPEGIVPIDALLGLEVTPARLHLLCGAGVALSVHLIADVAPALCALLLWALYLAWARAGAPFLNFQWDVLLIETAFLGIWVAPWRLLPRAHGDRAPPTVALWLLRFLLFRLMLLSGLVKLLSGDPTWRDLTAMTFHYETQPLPGPLSRLVHFLPAGFHQAEALLMFAIELVLPFFVFGPRRMQHLTFVGFVGLQVVIAATGNYGFFNLLTAALCVLLIDDQAWRRFWPRSWALRGPLFADPRLNTRRWRRVLLVPVATVLVGLGLLTGTQRCLGWQATPSWMLDILRHAAPWRTVNGYGLFAVMTTERPEIVVQGSVDGQTWKTYGFRWKPGSVEGRPRMVQPHMPRLDWQMWFAALGSYRNNPWFLAFLQRLLEGSPSVLALLDENPFPEKPPRFLRAVVFDYRFARSASAWWKREREGLYCPVVTLVGGELTPVR